MDTNLFGTFAALKTLVSRNKRPFTFVMVASLQSLYTFPGYMSYAASKSALSMLFEAAKDELRALDITAKIYYTSTIMSEGFQEENTIKPARTMAFESLSYGTSCKPRDRACTLLEQLGHRDRISSDFLTYLVVINTKCETLADALLLPLASVTNQVAMFPPNSRDPDFLMGIIVILFACCTLCKNYGILFNGSCNFYNYRHTANIMVLSHILLSNGFTEKELVVFSGENAMCDPRNIDQKHVYLSETASIPVPAVTVEEATVQGFLNAVNCNHGKLVDCDKNSNMLIYMCGHGNKGFLKVQYRDAILSSDLNRSICKLAERVNKVLLIVDTCRAESFVSKSRFPQNVFALATSLISEPSVSSFSCSTLGVHCIDNFPYYLYRLTAGVGNIPLKDFFSMFRRSDLLSTIKCSFSQKESFYLDDFFRQVLHEEETLRPL
ncbi:UNVERIFIED_CONTAM: hypothetical protein PYX00_011029 [Menopon gallinae]|uniref:Uncharacterized protein n=1 Tax=Menopon gallinae TaxID=328185 RepID=A0AAW2H666_9NEOP